MTHKNFMLKDSFCHFQKKVSRHLSLTLLFIHKSKRHSYILYILTKFGNSDNSAMELLLVICPAISAEQQKVTQTVDRKNVSAIA